MVSQATKYELLEAGDKSDRTSSDDGANASRLALALQKERRYLVLFYANIALFLVTITLGGFFWLNPRKPSQMECAKLTSPYSPLWDIVDFWEGDFTNYFNHTSKYRGPPTLARERAWDDLWNVPGVVIGQDGIDALNKTSQGPWVETTDSTPAKREYKVLIEVFHQLHCLNLIRQATWPLTHFRKDWGELYPDDLVEPLAARMHVDHCIETLRLSLQCYADVTPVLIRLTPERQLGSMADFNVHHKCRNFDRLITFMRTDGRNDTKGIPHDKT